MSKEQIEEIAKTCPYNVDGECVLDETRCTTDCEVAKWGHSLVEGYRKQSEGEWIYQEYSMGHYVGKCSLCECEADMTNYCPNCGAKMKGGVE